MRIRLNGRTGILPAFCVGIALCTLGLIQNACSSNPEQAPNVILVMTDDQGYGDIGAHGSPYVKTPTLDRLHQESVRFTNFHVDPCCSPTRAALLTGLYSARTGVWHTIGGRSLLREGKVTIADVFQANGYRTGIFGKWHLGDNYPFRPQDRGFQEVLVHFSGSVGNRWDHWGNDYYDDTYYRNGRPEKFEGYCNTVWFEEALKFIDKNRSRPFFCFLSTNIPHAPLHVDPAYSEPYKTQVSEQLANFYGMLTKFDEDLAVFLDRLREWGLEENTILIFMTDNGPCPWYGGIKLDEDGFVEEGYSAGMRGGKIWGYENAHRVPFFVRWPAAEIGGGWDQDTLAAHIDLLPTLIEICQLKPPEGVSFDGRSLVPLFTQTDAPWEERTLFVHNQRVDFPVKYKDYQVLTQRWRLVRRETDELYDIKNDIGQRNDLAVRHPEIAKRLKQAYEDWWADVSQDFDFYDQTIIGTEHENPLTLYSHDAHSRDQHRIWVIKVAQEGRYRFSAARWPVESQKKIMENREGNLMLPLDQAHLIIGNVYKTAAVKPDLQQVDFTVSLKPGITCLEAWLTGVEPEKRYGVEFVYVERLGPADPEAAAAYLASDPDKLLKESE
jgi:arylsulfatase A-like enzyme